MLPASTLALAMIVRNEARHIGTALEHAHRFADQIVIVDTGSTDGTQEICAKFADELIDYAWHDDFSAARNAGLARCKTDFIIWLDADDMISRDTASGISSLMRATPAAIKWDVLMLPYLYARDAQGNVTLRQWRERIFRNGLGLRFQYPVHECLSSRPGLRIARHPNLPIVHNKVAPSESSHERNLRILRNAVASEAWRDHPSIWAMLAREERPAQAIPIFRQLFARFPDAWPPGALSELLVINGRKLMATRRHAEARNVLERARAVYPDWREPHYYLAQALWALNDDAGALVALDAAAKIAAPGAQIGQHNPTIYDGIEFLEWEYLVCKRLGLQARMQAAIAQALSLAPRHPRFLRRQRKGCV